MISREWPLLRVNHWKVRMDWLETKYSTGVLWAEQALAKLPGDVELIHLILGLAAVILIFWWLKPKPKRPRNIFRQ